MVSQSRPESRDSQAPVDPALYDKDFYLDPKASCGCGGWKMIQDSGGVHFPPYYGEFYELARIKAGSRVLDIGCGRGEFVVFCATRGVVASGVDYSVDAIEIASKLKEQVAQGRGDRSIAERSSFQQADAKALPFPDGEFDVVVSRAVVEHLHQWELLQVLRECKRLLKPAGTLVITTNPNVWYRNYGFPFIYNLKRLLPFLRRLSGETTVCGNPRAEREMGLHVNEQSVLSLRRTLKQAGFKGKVWLGPRFGYRAERFSKELGLAGIPLYFFAQILETWIPLKYVFADEIYAVAHKA